MRGVSCQSVDAGLMDDSSFFGWELSWGHIHIAIPECCVSCWIPAVCVLRQGLWWNVWDARFACKKLLDRSPTI